ncbi:MAG TPA: helix-turn-helix domain-containing protein [Ktedonobacteraceae bacterium]|nr:helix-turn-helix domain-containing protein [Ktedonobacteraceae bacterium]
MLNRSGSGRFAFIDAGEAARMLDIDRVTLEQWVREGRLRAHRGVGRDAFYRTSDVEALYNELHPATELAQAIADDERESGGDQAQGGPITIGKGPVRKKQDPQMRVYLRLQADAKWYDISEDDIRTWFKQLAPDGYERNKRNAQHAIKKLQYLVEQIEEGQGRS